MLFIRHKFGLEYEKYTIYFRYLVDFVVINIKEMESPGAAFNPIQRHRN